MRKLISLFLVLILLMSAFPIASLADGQFIASDLIVEFIKQQEGSIRNADGLHVAYRNPGEANYTIGYGHCGPDVTAGMTITEEEATRLFRQDIASFEAAVNNFNVKYGLGLSQNQFDALLSLTYNLGPNWFNQSYRLAAYLRNGLRDSAGNAVDDLEIADSFGVICSSGGVIWNGLITRRLAEARIFLYGNYFSDAGINFSALRLDVPESKNDNRVVIYYRDEPYGSLPKPASVESGKVFLGWMTDDGAMLKPSDIAGSSVLSVSAVFGTGEAPKTYNVTVSNGFGSGSYTAGDYVCISPGFMQNYKFTGWSGDSVELTKQGDRYYFVMPARDVYITANFEKLQTRMLNVIGGTGSGEHAVGHSICVMPEVHEGYSFVGWESSLPGLEISSGYDGYYFFMPDCDLTLTAIFEASGVENSSGFYDVPDSYWACEQIKQAVARGIFAGKSQNRFCPDEAMNRAMLVTVLYRMSGSPSVDGMTHEFSDLDRNAYYDAIVWASNTRIANGYADGTFRPYDNLTRQQLATFLLRYANYRGFDTEVFADISQFSDVSSVVEYAVQPMEWAVGAGIISGYTDMTLRPQNNATRAQVAVMLCRFMNSFGI